MYSHKLKNGWRPGPSAAGCDLVTEIAVTQTTTAQAIHMTQKGSTIVLVGYSKSGEMTLPMSMVLDKELTFKSVFRYRHIYPCAIEAVASGKVNLKGIVTDVFGLDEVQKAMDYSVNNKADVEKGESHGIFSFLFCAFFHFSYDVFSYDV